MAIKGPRLPSQPVGFRPPSGRGGGGFRRSGLRPLKGQAQVHDAVGDVVEYESPLAALAQKVQGLNRRASSEWTSDDYRELERLAEMLLADAENQAKQQHTDNPFARQQLVEASKLQLRMLLQSLQPPEEMLELFNKLWARARSTHPDDLSTFVRKSIMTASTRRDVMNRQVEEAVDEADRHATQRRVEAIGRDAEHGSQRRDDAPPESDDAATQNASERPDRTQTLKQTLRVLRKKRRNLGRSDAEDAAEKALDTMRVLRELVAPRWAPETQPWLVNTADTHVYQTLLAVMPEALLKETNAYQGIQNLRTGEHAFAQRAAERIMEGARRS